MRNDMNDVLKADVFFVVASAGIVVLGVMLAIALAYAIRILRDVKEVSREVKAETEHITEDITSLRRQVRQKGTWLLRLFVLAKGLKLISNRRRRTVSKNKHTN